MDVKFIKGFSMSYDSKIDTLKHIKLVNKYLGMIAQEFIKRGECHNIIFEGVGELSNI